MLAQYSLCSRQIKEATRFAIQMLELPEPNSIALVLDVSLLSTSLITGSGHHGAFGRDPVTLLLIFCTVTTGVWDNTLCHPMKTLSSVWNLERRSSPALRIFFNILRLLALVCTDQQAFLMFL
jgi:hypothetical protein